MKKARSLVAAGLAGHFRASGGGGTGIEKVLKSTVNRQSRQFDVYRYPQTYPSACLDYLGSSWNLWHFRKSAACALHQCET